MRYSHFRHVDPGQWKRKLGPEHHERVVRMKEESGLTYGAIAHWFTRNGTPVSYRVVQRVYEQARSA